MDLPQSFCKISDEIWSVFTESSVCLRCILRFSGCKTTSVYNSDDDRILQTIGKSITSLNCCPLCLNISSLVYRSYEKSDVSDLELESNEKDIVDDAMSIDILQQCKEMLSLGFHINDFSLHLKLPPSIAVHQEAFFRCHGESIGDLEQENVIDVKDTLRLMISPMLEKTFYKSNCNPQSDLVLTINIYCEEADSIAADALGISKPKQQRQYSRGNYRPKRIKADAETNLTNSSVSHVLHNINTEVSDSLISLAKGWKTSNSEQATNKLYSLKCTVSMVRNSMYVYGRYRKLSRNVTQSPLIINSKRIGEGSVQEIIAEPLIKFTGCESVSFASSGREDIDVRMLGSGRPFVIEIQNGKTSSSQLEENLKSIEDEINKADGLNSNGSVEVIGLKMVDSGIYSTLQDGAENKKKNYRCMVWCSSEITQMAIDSLEQIKDLVVNQKTPVRVLHRRAQLTRVKIVHNMSGRLIDPHFFELDIKTSAGMYVKEFVHGDLGRTVPNLGTILGFSTDILQLDVIGLEDNNP